MQRSRTRAEPQPRDHFVRTTPNAWQAAHRHTHKVSLIVGCPRQPAGGAERGENTTGRRDLINPRSTRHHNSKAPQGRRLAGSARRKRVEHHTGPPRNGSAARPHAVIPQAPAMPAQNLNWPCTVRPPASDSHAAPPSLAARSAAGDASDMVLDLVSLVLPVPERERRGGWSPAARPWLEARLCQPSRRVQSSRGRAATQSEQPGTVRA